MFNWSWKPARGVAVLMLSAAGACSFLTGVDPPDQLALELESDATELTLVTSTYFLMVEDPECEDACGPIPQLVTADTTIVSPPYDRVYAFTSRQQYFVEVWPTNGEAATITMKIAIDGKVWYDDFRTLVAMPSGGEQETLRFVYNFRELVIQ